MLVLTPAVLVMFASPLIAAYLDGPPPAHTGGFDEPTCAACHFGADLNDPKGALALAGVPGQYTPGQQYLLTITLGREEMERGGFEVSARFAEGGNSGTQAGAFEATSDRVAISTAGTPVVQYAHHTAAGAELKKIGKTRWKIRWTAPSHGDGEVIFHVAANAANGDDSVFGDHIYTTEAISASVGSTEGKAQW